MWRFTCKEDLECAICYGFAVSPIKMCLNDHLVCGICSDKKKICDECGERLSACRLAEKYAEREEFELFCSYEVDGCSKMIKSTEMKNHIDWECDYRPIVCPVSENCSESQIKLENLEDHLERCHQVLNYSNRESPRLILTKCYHNLDSSETMIVMKWFEDRMFLVHSKLHEGFLYEWLSVIGDQSVADEYTFAINFPTQAASSSASSRKANKAGSYSPELRVVPIQLSQFAQVKQLKKCFGKIYAQDLIPFCKEGECPNTKKKYEYTLTVTHEIKKTSQYQDNFYLN